MIDGAQASHGAIYPECVSEGFRTLCEVGDVYPYVLDNATFSSFDTR